MTGLQWLLHCIWTTKPDAYGMTGLVLGGLVGAALAFRMPYADSAYVNGQIGKAFAVVFALAGMFAGEIVRVLWTGVCELP